MSIIITSAPYNAVADGKKTTSYATVNGETNQISFADPLFTSADIGKFIFIIRQDVTGGLSPWYGTGLGGVQITGVPVNTEVNISTTCSPAPAAGVFPPQSWPYANTPVIVLWGTDNYLAIQNAILAGVGGDVFIPTGVFGFAHPVYLPSNTTLRGYSTGSVLMPLGITNLGWFGTSSGTPALCNEAYKNYFNPNAATGNLQNAMTADGDSNISISNMTFDMSCSAQGVGGANTTIRFFLLNGGSISNLTMVGNAYFGYEGPNCVGCGNITIDGNNFSEVGYGFNPWCGCYNINVTNNTINVPYSGVPSVVTYGAGPYCGIEINVVGTAIADSQHSYNINIANNTIYLNGSAINTYGPVGIEFFPDGLDCPITSSTITGNKIYCSNSFNDGIVLVGASNGVLVDNNMVMNSDGGQGPYVFSVISAAGHADTPGTSDTSIISASSVSGSNLVTIQWNGHGYVGTFLYILPTYFYAAAGPTVGGVALAGYFAITSVVDSNHFVINAQANASSTETISWNGSFGDLSQYPQGTKITNNQLYNCNANANPLIYMNGIGVKLRFNSAIYDNTTVHSYLCFIASQGVDSFDGGVISGNDGYAGTGVPAGYSGNSTICWGPYGTAPAVYNT